MSVSNIFAPNRFDIYATNITASTNLDTNQILANKVVNKSNATNLEFSVPSGGSATGAYFTSTNATNAPQSFNLRIGQNNVAAPIDLASVYSGGSAVVGGSFVEVSGSLLTTGGVVGLSGFSLADIGNVSASVNVDEHKKVRGALVFDESNTEVWMALGSNANSAWKNVSNVSVSNITPS